MKSLKILRVLLIASFLSTVFLSCFLLYQKNIFLIKEEVVKSERIKEIKKVKVAEIDKDDSNTKREAICSDLTKAMQTNSHKQGYIAMQSLNILLPILDNAYNSLSLSNGANILPSGTNGKDSLKEQLEKYFVVAIVGHNYNDGVTAFSPLQEHINKDDPYIVNGKVYKNNWLLGKKFYVSTDKNVYEYEIGTQYLIREDDLSVTEKDSIWSLKLITCLYPSDNYRIVTPAKLVNSYTWQDVPNQIITLFDLTKNRTNIHNDQFSGEEEGLGNEK